MTIEQPHICISYHAVTRYVQRVLHITVAGTWPDERTRARAHCHAAGTTIDAVRLIIWTPGIALAVKLGFRNVGLPQFEVAISQPQGVVTTIKPPRDRAPQRLVMLSDKEFQRRTKRMTRTNKRRPSSSIGRTFLEQEET